MARLPRRTLLGLVLLLPLSLPGCITRSVQEQVAKVENVEVFLRHHERRGKVVEKGWNHPTVISAERLSHILALVDTRVQDGDTEIREPAVSSGLLLPAAQAMSEAFAEASPDQDLIVMAIERSRRFGVFTRKYLTNFVAAMRGDDLLLGFSRIAWEVPRRLDTELPRPDWNDDGEFRIAPGPSILPAGRQRVAIDWRDPIFGEPAFAERRDGVRRRTVLFDSPGARAGDPREDETLPEDLPPETRRALEALEEERLDGRVSEQEYRRQREDLLRQAP